MRWLPFLLVAVLAVLFQVTVVRVLAVRNARPDLMVAVLVVFSVGARPSDGFPAGAVTGLLRDLFSTGPLGLGVAVFAVLGWLLARGRAGAVAEHALTHAVLGLLCSLAVSGAGLVALLVSQEARAPSLGWAAGHAAVVASLTAVASGVLGVLVWRRRRWFGLRRSVEFIDV